MHTLASSRGNVCGSAALWRGLRGGTPTHEHGGIGSTFQFSVLLTMLEVFTYSYKGIQPRRRTGPLSLFFFKIIYLLIIICLFIYIHRRKAVNC